MRTLIFRVGGLVQHVWFRGWTQMTAQGLGLSGWVRNLPDGTVAGQAQAEDTEQGRRALKRFQDLLWQGPPSARVQEVEARVEEIAERFAGFHVRR